MADTARLPFRTVALSTVLALGAAIGTYQLLTNDDAPPSDPGDTIALSPDGPSDPSDATFTTFDDEVVPLTSIYGTPTVVNFFASTCVPCVTEMPALEEVHQDLGDAVAFLGLAVSDRPEDAQALVEQTGITYPAAQDKDGSVITALGGSFLPTTVLLDADGTIVATHTGQLTAAELHDLITDKLGVPRMIDAPLAIAFASGMLTTVNPCGFAMLPAYLAYFLGLEGQDKDVRASVTRSIGVGLSVAGGFLLVFSLVGLATYHLSATFDRWTPWATIVIGGALLILGVAMVVGYQPIVNLPKLQRGGRTRDGGSMFLFGISYAIASISCAFPLFTFNVVGTFRRENLISSVAVFVAYALGMTLVLLALTISLGMARQSLLHWLRAAMPYVSRISGGLLVLAGGYLVHYGWYERRVEPGSVGKGSPIVDGVTGWSDDIADWIYRVGPTQLGLVLALAVASVLVATLGTRARR